MKTRRSLLLFACAWLNLGAAHAAPVQSDHIEAELVAERTALVRGSENWVALRLAPEKGWHVYWQNPGDTGLATKLAWTLPEGISAGAIAWPYPQAQKLKDLTNYGYDGETLHLVPITVADDWHADKPVTLKAQAKWLVCSDVCIPGTAQLSLTLPVSESAAPDPNWSAKFEETRQRLPQATPGWDAQFTAANGELTLRIAGANAAFDHASGIEFFPASNDTVNHHGAQRIVLDNPDSLRLSQQQSTYYVAHTPLRGVLVLHGTPTRAWSIEAQPGELAPVTAKAAPAHGLVFVLLSALLGGLILNLMPCVFPVLSLKALSLIAAREHGDTHQREHALAYTAGVLLSFAAIAGVLLAVRAAGVAAGWGFQLQSPPMVGALAYLMFALGLFLSGVAEFGIGFMGAGQALAQRAGLAGSFFTGMLATLVATPCTAPFMGAALGYALTQPPAVALLVFLALGLGLALPFLLLGFFPRLAAVLPRPGAWMETFKQFMAFPLYLTAAGLVWVLSRQTGADGAGLVLVGMVLVAFALWLWNRAGFFPAALRIAALAGALALLAAPGLVIPAPLARAQAEQPRNQPWSPARVAELRAVGRTVFVNFTADWCITCKVNERVALERDEVREAFRKNEVVWLTADWTRADPVITHELEHFGRTGVPLYLVYLAGAEPKVLPQVLTPGAVISAVSP